MAVTFNAGDWYVYKDEDGDAVAIAEWTLNKRGNLYGSDLARMAVPNKRWTQEQINKKARLIAAAPELLEALQGVLWMAEEWFKHGGDETTFSDSYKESLDEARAVILKATGEA